MNKLRFHTRLLRAHLRTRWMTCRMEAAEKKRCSHENTPAFLKEMWESYLSFAHLEF